MKSGMAQCSDVQVKMNKDIKIIDKDTDDHKKA